MPSPECKVATESGWLTTVLMMMNAIMIIRLRGKHVSVSRDASKAYRRVRFDGGASMRTQIEKKVQSVSFECAQWEHLINNNNNNIMSVTVPRPTDGSDGVQWKRDRMCE